AARPALRILPVHNWLRRRGCPPRRKPHLHPFHPGVPRAFPRGGALPPAPVVDVQHPAGRPSGGRMSTLAVAKAPASVTPLPNAGWIANASYDGLFFVGSLISGVVLTMIALASPALGIPATIVAGIAFNNTHNLITGLFYFDKQNLAYYRQFPHYYFTMPLLLMVCSIGIFVYSPALGFTLHFFFTVWHVARQSVGVQKLYLGRIRAADFERKFDATLI